MNDFIRLNYYIDEVLDDVFTRVLEVAITRLSSSKFTLGNAQ